MEVAIAGGHGKIGLLLGALLAESEDAPRGLIRDPAQEDDLHAAGIEPVICDYGGAVKLIEAAQAAGVSRYMIVSAMGAGDPPAEGAGAFGEYLRAKAKADQELVASGLDYTIVRPGSLTDDSPTGLVAVGERLDRGAKVPRADLAAVLAAVLHHDNTIGKTFELVSGETPIPEAVGSL